MTYKSEKTKHMNEKSYNEMLTDYSKSNGKNDMQGDTNAYLTQNKAALLVDELTTNSPEKVFEEQTEKKIFWTAVNNCLTKRFNATQVKIWNTRAKLSEGKRESVATICKNLKISPKDYHREMRGIKEIFDNEIETLSNIY